MKKARSLANHECLACFQYNFIDAACHLSRATRLVGFENDGAKFTVPDVRVKTAYCWNSACYFLNPSPPEVDCIVWKQSFLECEHCFVLNHSYSSVLDSLKIVIVLK